MRNRRNVNAPPMADLVQVYIDSAYDTVKLVADNMATILALEELLGSGGFEDLVKFADIDTLAELNEILTDANLGDIATLATAAQGIKADTAVQAGDIDTLAKLNAYVQDEEIASEAYVALAVAGLYDHKGGYNANTNTPDLDTAPSGIMLGDAYTVNIGGTFYATDVAAGDLLIANQDDPTSAADWTIVNRNIDEAAFATAEQGAKADTAIQPNDNISTLTNDSGFTDDQTGAEIKVAYEGEANTNAFTDGEKTSLGTMEDNSKDDQTAGEIKTAFDTQVAVVTQLEAESGTVQVVKQWTPERVKQAIKSLEEQPPEGTVILSTGETVGKVLTADGDNSSSWQDPAGGGGAARLYKSGAYTASTAEVVFADSTGGAIQVDLPASPNTDDFVSVFDTGGEAGTQSITVGRNGQTIVGVAENFVLDVDWASVDLIFDGTTWRISMKGVFGTGGSGGGIDWTNATEDFLTTGSATVGAFTSTGIRDVATRVTMVVNNNYTELGNASSQETQAIHLRSTVNGSMAIAGGNTTASGGNIRMYGPTHATKPRNIEMYADADLELEYNDVASSWDFQDNAIITTGALTCGTFTSTGIDDNATGERLQLANGGMTLGTVGTDFNLLHVDTEKVMTLGSNPTATTGVQLRLHGSTHPTQAYDLVYRRNTTKVLHYDDSASLWDFQANDMATTGTFACGAANISGWIVNNVAVGGNVAYLQSGDDNFVQLRFKSDSDNRRFLAVKSDNTVESQLKFGVGQIEIAGNHATNDLYCTIAADVTVAAGDLVIGTSGKGIDFGTSVFDDYETGSWTPELMDNTLSDLGQTYQASSQIGRYVKIGDWVECTGRFIITGLGTLNGGAAARISGLPFTSSSAETAGTINMAYATGMAITSGASICGTVTIAAKHVILRIWDAVTGNVSCPINHFTTSSNVRFTISYKVD